MNTGQRTHSLNAKGDLQSNKYTEFHQQEKIFKEYLKKNTATSSMVSDATGIAQKNLCRYKRWLEDSGELVEVFHGKCQSTGFPAWYLSTNEDLIKSVRNQKENQKKQQLKLFSNGNI